MTPPPRTILHVPRRFTADEWGGTETVVLEIARRPRSDGWNPAIVTSLALSDRRSEALAGIPVYRHPYFYPYFGLSRSDKAALDKKGGNLVSFSLLFRLLTTPNVRLFHAHALKRLGGEVRTAARLRRKPCVVTLHGGVFDVPASELESLLAPTRRGLEWGKALGALFGSRKLLSDADLVLCVGETEFARARKALDHDRIAYLPNGVDFDRFAMGDGPDFRRRHGIPASAFLVLQVSRIDAQKNQALLLAAFRDLRASVPEARLLFVGPETQPEYARSLRARIAEYGLAESVAILPGLRPDDPDLVRAYHAADVFVLPSVHEPFGIVVLEAWSAARPVVAAAGGGPKTLLRHEDTGMLFEPEATDAPALLAGILLRLARHPDLRENLGRNGREEARSKYDWQVVAARLDELYRAAEAHHARRRGHSKP
ncbi:MAG: glycosyltransferase family 4 protein [Verrucomicrobiales bacterium]|nr:glycosyltransferase family 4 protein [Verrucomicrobiales bacterium]